MDTRPHTGRSPKDKLFVREPSSEEHIDWGDTNQEIEASRFDALWDRVAAYLSERDAYSLDCYVGADVRYRVPLRVYTELAWHNLFARHLFITPEVPPQDFVPEFTIVDAALFQADPQRDGTRSGTFILVNFARRMILIGGTRYAGEIKKSVFTVMNYLLPLRDVLPMHCSANAGGAGDVAILFGLSGTGSCSHPRSQAYTCGRSHCGARRECWCGDQLNMTEPAQDARQSILDSSGHVLVRGGAGSGKP